MTDPDRPFWDRHHFARLTRRWSDVVGADRTTVVVVNEHDHDWLCRVFEQLVGLRAGTLQVPAQRTNRSLNLGEVELLRQLNGVLKRYEWNGRTHLTFVRQGVSPGLKRAPADPHAGRIRSGADVDLLADLQRQHYAELEALGVEIVGRQEWLDLPAPSASDRAEAEQDPSLSMESAVAGVMGAIESTQAMGRFPLDGTPPAELLRPPAVSAGDGAVRSAATLLDALEAACATHGWDPADVRRHLAGARLGAQAALGEGRWTKVTDPDRSVPDGRISPRLVAGVIGGVIASSDPAAEPATPSPLPSRSRSLRGAWRRGR